MAQLRDPDSGCQWDREQTFATIAPYTIEEAYEVADAIERGDMNDLRDELGDLLLQVVFHAQMASDDNLFDFESVAQGICEKMVRRHPHVFADTVFDSVAEQKAHWEQLKADERQARGDRSATSALDGVALALPALTRAEKIQKRAARVGFDWPGYPPVVEKVDEELQELRDALGSEDQQAIDEELGDLLFTLTNLARHLDISPERSLQRATAKFERRFRHMEAALAGQDSRPESADAQTLDRLWHVAKKATSDSSD